MRSLVAVFGVLTLGACAHQGVLEPAPGSALAPGTLDVAEATVAGVTVTASGDSWNGDPWDLYRRYAPVLVTVENHGQRAVSLSPAVFSLTTPGGARDGAVLPSATHGLVGWRSVPTADVRWARWEAEMFVPNPFDDPRYYDEEFRDERRERLPTREMLRRALSVGPVPAGARVSGFVYFEPPPSDPTAIQFEMSLVDAANGQAIGHLVLPFQLTRR